MNGPPDGGGGRSMPTRRTRGSSRQPAVNVAIGPRAVEVDDIESMYYLELEVADEPGAGTPGLLDRQPLDRPALRIGHDRVDR